jgi:hypothetical protein
MTQQIQVITRQNISLPIIKVDESWIKLLKYAQDNPFSCMNIEFRNGNPFEIIETKNKIRL